MTRRNLRLWTVDVGLCTLLTATAAAGITADNAYHPIIDRNVFGLRPMPPPAAPAEPAKPPPPRLWLTGITTIFGNKRALLKGNFPNKPGEPAKDQSFILGEGQRDGDIEIIKIDEKEEIVTVDDFGTVTNLTFEKDVPKTASAPAPAGAGGMQRAGFPAFGSPVNPANPRQIPMPLRPIRTASELSTGQENAMSGSAAAPGMAAGEVAENVPVPPTAMPADLTRDQQAVLMEAQRDAHKDDATFPPLPPTALSEMMDAENAAAAANQAPPTAAPNQRPVYPIPGRPPGLPPPF